MWCSVFDTLCTVLVLELPQGHHEHFIYLSVLPKLSRRTMKKLTNRLIIVQEITITSKTKHKHLAVYHYHYSHFQRTSLHTSMFLGCLQNMYQGQSLVLRIGNIQVYRKNHDCWFWRRFYCCVDQASTLREKKLLKS